MNIKLTLTQKNLVAGICAVLILSTLACWVVLKIKKSYNNLSVQVAAKTIVFPSVDVGDSLLIHGALTNAGNCTPQGCQLILGITNRLSESRRNVISYWSRLLVRLSDLNGPVFTHFISTPNESLLKQMQSPPEFFNLADLISLLPGETLNPNEVSVREIFFFSTAPNIATIRRNPGFFQVINKPGKYHLEVIYKLGDSERVLFDDPDFTVQ